MLLERYNSQMSVEAFCWSLVEQGEDTLEDSLSVVPGDSAPINFLNKVRLVTICGINNETASVWVVGNKPEKHIRVIIYKDKDDDRDEGKALKINSKNPIITIAQPQKLEIYSKKNLDRAVVICLEEDEEDDEEDDSGDDGNSDKKPVDSPEEGKILVAV